MSHDLFEQLAGMESPPPPESLAGDVHRRVNRTLLVLHLTEFCLKGMLYAVGHLLAGLRGVLVMTLSGKFPVDQPGRPFSNQGE